MGSGSSKKKKLGTVDAVKSGKKWRKKSKESVTGTNFRREEEEEAEKEKESEEEQQPSEELESDREDENEEVEEEEKEDESDGVDEEADKPEEEDEEQEEEEEPEDEQDEDEKQEVETDNDQEEEGELEDRDGEENENAAITLQDYSSKLQKALVGDLDIDFPENVKVVRIFTSSTFTDTSVERNTLMVKVYPRVKKFCQERGYEFQIVDMRWGVRDESTDDHLTSELCMRELYACQRLSTGPNFITFLGQKYGYRPFPPKIPAKEFEQLLNAINEQDDINLLKIWFLRNDNNVPPEYILQPISSILPNYRNYDKPDLRKEASSTWWAAFERMQVVFRMAADKVLTKKQDRLKYYMSVTEDEIRRGIINSKDPSKHTFWFKRVITDLEEHVNDAKAGSFMDKTWGTPGGPDTEALSYLSSLREKDLPAVLPNSNIIRYDVKWNKNGIDPEASSEHARYIDNLSNDFYEKMTSMISDGVNENETADTREALSEEVFQHLSFCQKKCKAFFGRDDFLELIKTRLLDNDDCVVVLHGESGCGKTSLMAKVTTCLKSWFEDEKIIVVCRFIGTSPESSSIRLLLRNVCQHLCKVSGNSAEIPEDMKSLTEFFPECLEKAAENNKVVLVFDSLDQLSVDDGGRLLDWIPSNLPSYVYMVLSTLPGEEYQCLPNLRLKYQEECLVEVPKIPLDEAGLILDNWLKKAKKALQPKQRKEVMDSFQECPLPLYLKLAYDDSCRWKSYTPFKEWDLPPNIRDIISGLFDRVERVHGKLLVGHALGYITASKNGLTEAELEDLLSLDDEVLNDVYQYWTPPLRRLPPLLWIRIRSDINDYLIDRGADGTRVIFWYHRQFIEVARERYLTGDQATKIHANLSEYFLGTWSQGTKKPYVNKKGESLEDDRLVSEMPMFFGTSDEKPIFNLRKLSELPYHLYHSKQYSKMKEEALCNFEFLLAKLRGTSLANVLDDFKLYLSAIPGDPDVKIMHECLRLSVHPLTIEPKQFSTQLLGRMFKFQDRKDKYPYVWQILEQAKNASAPCFIPNSKFLTAPGGALVSTIALGNYGQECISIGNDNQTMASTTVTGDGLEIKIINFQTGEQLRKFAVTTPSSMYHVTKNIMSDKDINFLLLAGASKIFLLNTQTGQIAKTFSVDDDEWFSHHQNPPVSYADDENLLVALARESLRVWQTSDCKVIKDIPVKGIKVDEEFGHLVARKTYVVYNLNGQNTLHFVDIKQGREVDKVKINYKKSEYGTSLISDMKVTSKDQVIIVPMSQEDHLRIYDLVTADLVREITTFKKTQGMGSIQVTDDGKKALSIDMFEIRITDLEMDQSETCLRSAVFRTKLISRDGDIILAIGQDFILRVFDRTREDDDENKQDTTVSEYQGHKIADQVTMVQPAYDKRHAIAITFMQMSNSISAWDVITRRKVRQASGMTVYPSVIRLTQDGTRFVGLIHDEKLPHYKVINLKEGKIEMTLEGGACKRMQAFGMIDNQHMISLSRNRKNLKIWDIISGKVVDLVKLGNKDKLEELLVSPNGKVALASVTSTRETYPEETTKPLYLYNTVTKKQNVLTLDKSALSLYNAKISDDGKYLVSIIGWNYPYLWDLDSGKMLFKLIKPDPDSYDTASNAAINTKANVVVTSLGSGGIDVWDITKGNILRRIPSSQLTDIFLTSSGDIVIGRDQTANTLHCWNVNSGHKITALTSDGYANIVHVIGDRLVLAVGENPNLMIMNLHIPGKDSSTNQLPPSIYDGLPVEVHMDDMSSPATEKDSLDKDKVETGNFL